MFIPSARASTSLPLIFHLLLDLPSHFLQNRFYNQKLAFFSCFPYMQVTSTYFIKFANRDLTTPRFIQGTQFPPYLFTFLGFSSALFSIRLRHSKYLMTLHKNKKELAILTVFLSEDENKILVDAACCKFNETSLISESMYVLSESDV